MEKSVVTNTSSQRSQLVEIKCLALLKPEYVVSADQITWGIVVCAYIELRSGDKALQRKVCCLGGGGGGEVRS